MYLGHFYYKWWGSENVYFYFDFINCQRCLVIERLRIAFTANSKSEIRVYVFSKKRVHG